MAKSRTNENLTTSFTRILPEVVGTSCASRCAPDIDQADQYLGLNSTSGVYPFGDSAHTVWARDEPSHDRGACELSTLKVALRFSQSGSHLYFPAMPTHMETVLRAAAFAAEKHRNQRRKDEEASPYINHPIQLAYILVQADIEDPVVLAAAVLHDTVEDTNTTLEEL